MITVISGGAIVDSESMSVREEGDVVIENGAIRQVGGRHSGAADVTVDARGKWVMPGLVDAHVHFRLSTMNFARMTHWTEVEWGIHMARLAEDTVRRGFTSVRDLGGDVKGLIRAIASGAVVGPRIVRAGQMLTQTGGHGDTRGGDLAVPECSCNMPGTEFGIVADGVDAVTKASRHLLRDGSDFIKVHVSGGVASPADPIDSLQYTPAEIRAAVTEAEHRHTYVAAHAYSAESITMAVENGVRSVEHGNLIDTAAAEAVVRHGAVMVPTLVTYRAMDEVGEKLGLPARNRAKNADILAAGLRSLETAGAAGVTFGFGTDLIGETQMLQRQELAIRAEVQSPADVLRSMWTVNPTLMPTRLPIGVLREGAAGDVVVSNVDPVSDLTRFARDDDAITAVVLAGNLAHSV
ncbi:MAG: amidohydrolase family protein [Ilumatobacteraceae bacterium]